MFYIIQKTAETLKEMQAVFYIRVFFFFFGNNSVRAVSRRNYLLQMQELLFLFFSLDHEIQYQCVKQEMNEWFLVYVKHKALFTFINQCKST